MAASFDIARNQWIEQPGRGGLPVPDFTDPMFQAEPVGDDVYPVNAMRLEVRLRKAVGVLGDEQR